MQIYIVVRDDSEIVDIYGSLVEAEVAIELFEEYDVDQGDFIKDAYTIRERDISEFDIAPEKLI